MNLPIKYSFDHVGIAVHSLEESAKFYIALGLKPSPVELVAGEKVRVMMFELANQSRVELLEPSSDDSVVAKFLAKRGAGIHHICLRVDNINLALAQLKQGKFKLIHEEPIQGAHNCRVAFIHPSSTGGVLIELSQPIG